MKVFILIKNIPFLTIFVFETYCYVLHVIWNINLSWKRVDIIKYFALFQFIGFLFIKYLNVPNANTYQEYIYHKRWKATTLSWQSWWTIKVVMYLFLEIIMWQQIFLTHIFLFSTNRCTIMFMCGFVLRHIS